MTLTLQPRLGTGPDPDPRGNLSEGSGVSRHTGRTSTGSLHNVRNVSELVLKPGHLSLGSGMW